MSNTAIATASVDALREAESAIDGGLRRGRAAALEISKALARIHSEQLYLATHSRFADYVADRWGMSRAYAYRLIEVQSVRHHLEGVAVEPTKVEALHVLAKSRPDDVRKIWSAAVDMAGGKQPSIAQVRAASGATERARSTEWYTPPDILTAARACLGGIDLDPASSEQANRYVQAKRYYDAKQNGLAQPWRGRVWCNPPYSGHAGDWLEHAIEQVDDYAAAVLLLPASVGTRWFNAVYAWPWIPFYERVSFAHEGNAKAGKGFGGSVAVLITRDTDAWVPRFGAAFAAFGPLFTPPPFLTPSDAEVN